MDIDIEYCNPFDDKQDLWMRSEHLARYLWAKNYIHEHKFNTVLDIACANGYGTKILSNVCRTIVGIDNKEKYIEIARKNNMANNIEYILLDVDNNDLYGDYDVIVCFETLEHLKYPNEFLKKIYSCLDKDGVVLLSVPNSKFEIIENGVNLDHYHLHIFTYDDLKCMLSDNNFEIMGVLGQSKTNKIVNNFIEPPNVDGKSIYDIASEFAYPGCEDIGDSYSHIYVLKKKKTL